MNSNLYMTPSSTKNSHQTSTSDLLLNNNNNSNGSNNNKQQLSVKAYLMNKYETFKNPNEQQELSGSYLLNGTTSTTLNGACVTNNNATSSLMAPMTPTSSSQYDMPTKAKRHFSGGSNSSMQNSEDDDEDFDDVDMSSKSREEKRRISHTVAEQKRRNAIKHGYDDLQSLVPSCEFMDPSSSQKVCKATILKRSIDYIRELEMDKDKYEHEADSLKKEIFALNILKTNYEEILKHHRNLPKDNSAEQMDEAKFELFIKIADGLFQSFQTMTNPRSFGELSSTMLSWLEQICTSQNLKNLIRLSIAQMQSFT